MFMFWFRTAIFAGIWCWAVWRGRKTLRPMVMLAMALWLIGGVFNLTVVGLNGYQMPVRDWNGALNGSHRHEDGHSRLMPLADIWNLGGARFSLGDFLVVSGLALNLIYGGFRRPTGTGK